MSNDTTNGAAATPQGWRPVAEARQDGRWKLVKGPYDEVPCPAMLTDDGWIDAGGDQYRYVKPTEYYVIPDAPAPNPHVAAIEAAHSALVKAAADAVARLQSVPFGWDGDCGVHKIADELDQAVEKAKAVAADAANAEKGGNQG